MIEASMQQLERAKPQAPGNRGGGERNGVLANREQGWGLLSGDPNIDPKIL